MPPRQQTVSWITPENFKIEKSGRGITRNDDVDGAVSSTSRSITGGRGGRGRRENGAGGSKKVARKKLRFRIRTTRV